EASLHQREDAQDRGRTALKKVWQDSYDESCILELHARVDMDGLVREYADAVLERASKVMKKTRVPQALDRGDIEKQLRIWKERSYDVSAIEANLDAEPSVLTASVLAMREAVKKADTASEVLAGLNVSGFESRAAILREKLRDPIRHPDIDAEVELLREATESMQRVESRRKLERSRDRDFKERTKKVLELVMKQRRDAKSEAPLPSSEEVEKALEEPAPPRDAATNLAVAFTFEGFTVGESNRFAHTAAIAVAKQPAKAYNPLLITSGPGLGKTHLLHAIGNYIASHVDRAKVLYLTCEAFGTGLSEAREKGTLGAFRERVRGVDCLLIDDIQFLSGMPEVHEELFHAFNELHGAEKQIVLASDRPPKAIANLDDRLVSRFESGLVAGIEPPELATRVAILERRSREAKVTIEPDVVKLIAGLVENNVRDLGGALNRVAAFLGGGGGGLVITRTNPKRVREAYGLPAERVLWLTDREGSAEDRIAPALERIVYEIEDFMSKQPRGAVLIDGIEYLVSNNSFDAVLKFVRRLLDAISESQYALIISLGSGTVKEQELKVLEREMEVIRIP